MICNHLLNSEGHIWDLLIFQVAVYNRQMDGWMGGDQCLIQEWSQNNVYHRSDGGVC